MISSFFTVVKLLTEREKINKQTNKQLTGKTNPLGGGSNIG